MQEWVKPPSADDQGVYAEPVGAPSPLKTQSRVVDHTARLESRDWRSSSSDVFDAPSTRAGNYADRAALGPRAAAALAAMEAAAAAPSPDRATDFNVSSSSWISEKASSYAAPGPSGVPVGARVMKTQDGVPIPPGACDATWRAESGLVPKGVVDAFALPEAPPHVVPPGGVGTDPGYTVYTQRHESGKYPDDCVFGTAPVEGRNPFNRNGGYSKPIGDPTKREEYVV